MQYLAARAIDYDDLKEAGAQFSYPQALTSPEWAAIKALGRARRIVQAKQARPKEEGKSEAMEEAARKRRLQEQMMRLPPLRR